MPAQRQGQDIMLTGQPAATALQATVIDYFAGERAEMRTAIMAFLLVAGLTTWLAVASRTGFAVALLATVPLIGGAMAAGLVVLLIRDHAALPGLLRALDGEHRATALADEVARVGIVLSKFRYYRLGAAVLGALAIAGLTLSGRGWVYGVAAGLLLIVVAQVVIDHFSERRAHIYHAALVRS